MIMIFSVGSSLITVVGHVECGEGNVCVVARDIPEISVLLLSFAASLKLPSQDFNNNFLKRGRAQS